MIDGLPLQTNSPGKHTRGFGCYAHVLAAMAQDQCGEVLLPWELRRLIVAAIGTGVILDNEIPVGSDGWYRCFILYPESFIKLIAYDLGHGLLSCIRGNPLEIYEAEPTTANYLVIEHATRSGSHFTLGVINADYTYTDMYDPWPALPRGEIKTYRKWTVQK